MMMVLLYKSRSSSLVKLLMSCSVIVVVHYLNNLPNVRTGEIIMYFQFQNRSGRERKSKILRD